MDGPLILVVDGDAAFQESCASALSGGNLEVHGVASGAEALKKCAGRRVALVISEVYLSDMSGLELLERVKARSPDTDVLMATGHASVETAVQALKKGASDYLQKPVSEEDLREAVGHTLEQRRFYEDNVPLRNQLRRYELSRSFAAIEEPSRVAELGLDAFLKLSKAKAGFCAVRTGEPDWLEFLAERRVTLAAQSGEEWFRDLTDALFRGGSDAVVMEGEAYRNIFTGLFAEEFDTALAVPILVDRKVKGVYVLLRKAGRTGFTEAHRADADFLGGQVSLSFRAALRYQQARGMADIDPLTDLYNSRHLSKALEKRIEEALRTGRALSVLFLDLDNFREVNRMHGHQAGGRVLIEVGRILRRYVRGEDTVIRYGGDEFTVVLPNADTDSAREVAERIRLAIKKHRFLAREDKDVRITVSIGVATYPQDASSAQALIYLADQAMYRGKEASRDTVYAAVAMKRR